MPKTFQDAVAITRSLGVQYLWIDSLCILQDSREDWETEAANMKRVYAGCYAMISANASPNAHGGCFTPTSAPAAGLVRANSHAVDSKGPWTSKVRAHVRLTELRDLYHSHVTHRIGDALTQPARSRNYLDTRGWTFQERVLAPRILHFGKSEFAWECPETVTCECQTVITNWDRESRFKSNLADAPLRVARDGSQPMSRVDILLWTNFVREFTRRKLTYSTDILHAMSGLADYMSAATGAGYACGLWKNQMEEFLMWKVVHGEDSAHPNKLKMSRLDRSQPPNHPERPRRHTSYYAPSWSWASVIGPVDFAVGRLDTSDSDQVAHYRKDGKAGGRDRKRTPLLRDVKVECSTDSPNPFGPPRHASLTATCLTLPVSWVGKQKSQDSVQGQSVHGGRLEYNPPAPSSDDDDQRLAADFEPDVPDDDLDVRMGDSLLLMYVIEEQDATVAKVEGKTISGQKGVRLEGLVLTPGDSQAAYRRVGYFEATGTGWREVATARTITVV